MGFGMGCCCLQPSKKIAIKWYYFEMNYLIRCVNYPPHVFFRFDVSHNPFYFLHYHFCFNFFLKIKNLLFLGGPAMLYFLCILKYHNYYIYYLSFFMNQCFFYT
uniref:Uncharacterized protein n=1 Tax=Heterorhabditis bacteriophora TaxID=37862 RepID=A0A1I7WJS7_HETBA